MRKLLLGFALLLTACGTDTLTTTEAVHNVRSGEYGMYIESDVEVMAVFSAMCEALKQGHGPSRILTDMDIAYDQRPAMMDVMENAVRSKCSEYLGDIENYRESHGG